MKTIIIGILHSLKLEDISNCKYTCINLQGEKVCIKVNRFIFKDTFEIYTKDRSIYKEEITDEVYSYSESEMRKKLSAIGFKVVTKQTAEIIKFYYREGLYFSKRNHKPHADIFSNIIEKEIEKWKPETKN